MAGLPPTLSCCLSPVWRSRGAGPERHPGPQRHQRRGGRPGPPRARGLPGSAGRAWHHGEARGPGTCPAAGSGPVRAHWCDGGGAPSRLTFGVNFRGRKPASSASGSCAGGWSAVSACFPGARRHPIPRLRSSGVGVHTAVGDPPQGLTAPGTQGVCSKCPQNGRVQGTKTWAAAARADQVDVLWRLRFTGLLRDSKNTSVLSGFTLWPWREHDCSYLTAPRPRAAEGSAGASRFM